MPDRTCVDAKELVGTAKTYAGGNHQGSGGNVEPNSNRLTHIHNQRDEEANASQNVADCGITLSNILHGFSESGIRGVRSRVDFAYNGKLI